MARTKDRTKVAAVAAYRADGKLLMGLRGDVEKWCFPGGHVEPGENPRRAAVRELLEEAGLKAKSLELLDEVTLDSGVQVWAFACEVSGEPNADNDPDAEFVEYKWVDPDEMPREVLDNLYNKRDVVLRCLGLQDWGANDLAKAEGGLPEQGLETYRIGPQKGYAGTFFGNRIQDWEGARHKRWSRVLPTSGPNVAVIPSRNAEGDGANAPMAQAVADGTIEVPGDLRQHVPQGPFHHSHIDRGDAIGALAMKRRGIEVVHFVHPEGRGVVSVDLREHTPEELEAAIHSSRQPDLAKALADIPVGSAIAQGAHDYSHVLPPGMKEAGYGLTVRHAATSRFVVGRTAPQGLVANLTFQHDGHPLDAGYVEAEVEPDKRMCLLESRVGNAHRRKGLGAAAYEALLAHAKNHLGVTQVYGGKHSTGAGGVHRSLAAKHGLQYQPAPVPEGQGGGFDYDARNGAYAYDLKSELAKADDGAPAAKKVGRVPKAKPAPPPLVAVHNLSEDGLQHAHELGGLPAPSIAILHHEHPFDGFGGVTLVGDRDLVDPTKTPVFDADAYTRRHPRAKWGLKPKESAAFVKWLQPYHATVARGSPEAALGLIESRGPQNAHEIAGLQAAYLAEKGQAVAPVMRTTKHAMRSWINSPHLDAFRGAGNQERFSADDEYHHDLGEAVRRAIEEWVPEGWDPKNPAHQPEIEKEREQELRDSFDYANGEGGEFPDRLYFGRADSINGDLRRPAVEPDLNATGEEVSHRIALQRPEYQAWVKQKIAPILGQQYIPKHIDTADGPKERRIPYTLQSVLKEMTQGKKVQGQENGAMGLGMTRAMGAKKFKTLDQIRARAAQKNALVDPGMFKIWKKNTDDRFFQLADSMKEHSGGAGSFGTFDALAGAIGESYQRGKYLSQTLRDNGFNNVPPEKVAKVAEFARDLLKMPTEYFEAKPQRVVDLSEFKGAAVPHDARPETLQILAQHGVNHVERYNRADKDDRMAAVRRIAAAQNLHLSELAKAEFEGGVTAAHLYSDPGVRELHHAVRDNKDPVAVARMAQEMAAHVPANAVLVPMPGRTGHPEMTLHLAQHLSKITGRPILNALRGASRTSLYEEKKRGGDPSTIDLGFHQIAPIPQGHVPVIVDNVVGTGTTARAARAALPGATVLVHACDDKTYTARNPPELAKADTFEEVARLIQHPHPAERSMALKLSGTTPAHLVLALRNNVPGVLDHPKVNGEVLHEALLDPDNWGKVFAHPSHDQSHCAAVVRAACTPELATRAAPLLGRSPHTTSDHVRQLASLLHGQGAQDLLSHPASAPGTLGIHVLRLLASNLPGDHQAALHLLATHPSTPPDVLQDALAVRGPEGEAAARNPAAPPDALARYRRGDVGEWLQKLAGAGLQKTEDASFPSPEARERLLCTQMGFDPEADRAFQAGQLFSGNDRDPTAERRALLESDRDRAAAAAALHQADVDDVRAAIPVVPAPKLGFRPITIREVRAAFTDGEAMAEDVRAAARAGQITEAHLSGKHSGGARLAKAGAKTLLLKPSSGPDSPAAGIDQTHASQAAREAAFYAAAEILGVAADLPECRLLVIDGVETACMEFLAGTFDSAEHVREEDLGQLILALDRYRPTGRLHQWAVADCILGQIDRHFGNMLVNEDGLVRLIDEGSTFAGPAFDPAHDWATFIPCYLRYRVPAQVNMQKMNPEQRLAALETAPPQVQPFLAGWLRGIDPTRLRLVLARYGIDGRPCLERLAALLESPDPVDVAVCKFWALT